jgi:hypothetical protein
MYDYGCGIDGVWLGMGNAGLGTYGCTIYMNCLVLGKRDERWLYFSRTLCCKDRMFHRTLE